MKIWVSNLNRAILINATIDNWFFPTFAVMEFLRCWWKMAIWKKCIYTQNCEYKLTFHQLVIESHSPSCTRRTREMLKEYDKQTLIPPGGGLCKGFLMELS